MHELMACVASMIIMTMFILQTAANTNTFIEAVYCERTISEYMEEEYAEDEIPEKLKKYQDYKACELKSPSREAKKKAILEKH